MKIRVICCGNPFRGNDAAGLHVLALLEKNCPHLDAVDGGTGGLELISLMEGYDRVIIVDATSGIGSIGDVRVFRDGIPTWDVPGSSFHDIGIAEAVAIGKEIGVSPHVVLVGIEAGTVMPLSETLEPAVAQAVPCACSAVHRILREWGVHKEGSD
ncbi:MAG: hydrogenase maturation protease [Methanomicrobiales archaeon]|nr:hydrogenase maturation protease [Methanomicrobiales archaeon]